MSQSLRQILERDPHLPARFYEVLLRLHPELSSMFGDKKRQAEMFARMLVAIVDHYEDRPWIEEQLKTLGARHRRFKLTSAMYKHFNTALIVTLEEAAGDLWTVEVENAWMTALADIARTMQQA